MTERPSISTHLFEFIRHVSRLADGVIAAERTLEGSCAQANVWFATALAIYDDDVRAERQALADERASLDRREQDLLARAARMREGMATLAETINEDLARARTEMETVRLMAVSEAAQTPEPDPVPSAGVVDVGQIFFDEARARRQEAA